MFLNHKLPQNKTYSISESGRKLISDRTSRSLQENKGPFTRATSVARLHFFADILVSVARLHFFADRHS